MTIRILIRWDNCIERSGEVLLSTAESLLIAQSSCYRLAIMLPQYHTTPTVCNAVVTCGMPTRHPDALGIFWSIYTIPDIYSDTYSTSIEIMTPLILRSCSTVPLHLIHYMYIFSITSNEHYSCRTVPSSLHVCRGKECKDGPPAITKRIWIWSSNNQTTNAWNLWKDDHIKIFICKEKYKYLFNHFHTLHQIEYSTSPMALQLWEFTSLEPGAVLHCKWLDWAVSCVAGYTTSLWWTWVSTSKRSGTSSTSSSLYHESAPTGSTCWPDFRCSFNWSTVCVVVGYIVRAMLAGVAVTVIYSHWRARVCSSLLHLLP